MEGKSPTDLTVPYEDLTTNELWFSKYVEKDFYLNQGKNLIISNRLERSDILSVESVFGDKKGEGS